MYLAHDYLAVSRQQELIREAQHARLVRCALPFRPWRRHTRRPRA